MNNYKNEINLSFRGYKCDFDCFYELVNEGIEVQIALYISSFKEKYEQERIKNYLLCLERSE